MRTYKPHEGSSSDRAEAAGKPVIMCPNRFAQDDIVLSWLAEIVGFQDVFVAREVPFMRSPTTARPAGRIDFVVSGDDTGLRWFGLEVQAVYFSGKSMNNDFDLLLHDTGQLPPMPTSPRRPDWRSSSAKRLMPQLQVKVPTLRRWGTKLAVAVDSSFFEAVGGRSSQPSQDINEGDIIWLVLQVSDQYTLESVHWEVLSLEMASDKLLAAQTVAREEFENTLRSKLQSL